MITGFRFPWVALALLPLSGSIWASASPAAGIMNLGELQHRATLDQMGKFTMLWTPLEEEIHVEIQVATTGYIGIGFSPSGGMKGADIVLAWVDDLTGELHVHDRFAPGMVTPVIDETQDITVSGGYQNDTHTVLRFSRPWDTCDKDHDLKLSGDTTRVIWAFSNEDPYSDMAMGKHDERGTKSLYLREPRFDLPQFSVDVKSIDLLMPQVALPDDLNTLYWCQIYKIPDLVQKHHMIGYVPVIQEGNHQQVHHMLLQECHLNNSSVHYDQWLATGGRQCYMSNMPASWRFCSHTVIAWAIGAEGEMFPEHVGLPLGENHGGSDYFMVEMHYDNPNFKKGVVDSSGLRIFYTDKTREIDGGVLMIGSSVTATMIVPPRQKWYTTGICSGECTAQTFPEDGIKVFVGLLHAHLLGRKITVKQIRNGRELPSVFKDMNYDFNYQQQRVLKEEMVILPGDQLIVECTHDATTKEEATFGGEGTNDEMCLAYLTYYPRVELSRCLSGPVVPTIYEALGVEDIYNKERTPMKGTIFQDYHILDENRIKEMDKKILLNPSDKFDDMDISLSLKRVLLKEPEEYRNKTLYDVLHNPNTWKDQKMLKKLQTQMTYGDHAVECKRTNGFYLDDISPTIRHPDFVTFKPLEEDKCGATRPAEVYVTYDGAKSTEVKQQGLPEVANDRENHGASATGSIATLSPLFLSIFILFFTGKMLNSGGSIMVF